MSEPRPDALDTGAGTPRPWYAYFTVHGDPWIVSDLDSPTFSRIAEVSTAPDDYGRANALLIVEAVNILDAARSRPATDPAGLDVALAHVRQAIEWHRRGTRPTGISAELMHAEHILARLSVADGPGPEERPEIVCLCGSTRFYDEFQAANYDLTMLGKIVLSVGFYPHALAKHGHGEGVGHDSSEKVALDELHKRKIDLADRVYVLNVNGYIGDSTRSEIEYAEAHGKPVDYLEPGWIAALPVHREEPSR